MNSPIKKAGHRAGELTILLATFNDPKSLEALLELTYSELCTIASAHCQREPCGRTLQATELVHETLIRFIQDGAVFKNRRHFFGAVGRTMRRVLVDRARRRAAGKRGGDLKRVDLTEAQAMGFETPSQLLDLDAAMSRLRIVHPEWSEIVDLRLFAGRSTKETAELLGIGVSTAGKRWMEARGWLRGTLSERNNRCSRPGRVAEAREG